MKPSGITRFTITENPDRTITTAQTSGTPSDGTLSTAEHASFNDRFVPILTGDFATIAPLPSGGVSHRSDGAG